jgi:ATP phosphoribosyltransferase
LPKGSLERATVELFEAADLPVIRSSDVDYRATIKDHRISEVRVLRPQEIPRYVADGLFDIGITGRDWVEETGASVVSLGELAYSKATSNPIQVVLAVAAESPWMSARDMPDGVKVSTEYPLLTERFFAESGVKADVVLSYGATETGRALKAAGLRIIETVLISYTELIANPASAQDPERRKAMEDINTLLQGALKARGRVLVKLNVEAYDLDRVIKLLPAMRSPTVSELFGGGSYAVETVVPKDTINKLIPELKDAGATDIIELPISKIVP